MIESFVHLKVSEVHVPSITHTGGLPSFQAPKGYVKARNKGTQSKARLLKGVSFNRSATKDHSWRTRHLFVRRISFSFQLPGPLLRKWFVCMKKIGPSNILQRTHHHVIILLMAEVLHPPVEVGSLSTIIYKLFFYTSKRWLALALGFLNHPSTHHRFDSHQDLSLWNPSSRPMKIQIVIAWENLPRHQGCTTFDMRVS